MPSSEQMGAAVASLPSSGPIPADLATLVLHGALAATDGSGIWALWLRILDLPASHAEMLLAPGVIERVAAMDCGVAASPLLVSHPQRRASLESLAATAERDTLPGLAERVAYGALLDPALPDLVARMCACDPNAIGRVGELTDELTRREMFTTLADWVLGEAEYPPPGATGDPAPLQSMLPRSLFRAARAAGDDDIAARLSDLEAVVLELVCDPGSLDAAFAARCGGDLVERTMDLAVAKGWWNHAMNLIQNGEPALHTRLLRRVPWTPTRSLSADDRANIAHLNRWAMAAVAERLGDSPSRVQAFWALGENWQGTYGDLVDAVMALEATPAAHLAPAAA